MCNAQSVTDIQTILLKDRVGPVLTCSPNITVSTDVWSCDTDLNMPKPGATDACSVVKTYQLFSTGGIVVELGGQFKILNLPVGVHIARWVVTDECFNSSSCFIQITVKDNVPPVVSCQAHTVVALTNDRPNGINTGAASSFNDGSFDNCSEVLFRHVVWIVVSILIGLLSVLASMIFREETHRSIRRIEAQIMVFAYQ
jgi:hypothetical protein